jgi:hypothetical protein
VFENRVLRGIFRSKRRYWATGEKCVMSFITCTLHQILLGLLNDRKLDGWGMYHAWRV